MTTTIHIKKSISIGFLSSPIAKIVVLAILTLATFQGGLLAQENNYTNLRGTLVQQREPI